MAGQNGARRVNFRRNAGISTWVRRPFCARGATYTHRVSTDGRWGWGARYGGDGRESGAS